MAASPRLDSADQPTTSDISSIAATVPRPNMTVLVAGPPAAFARRNGVHAVAAPAAHPWSSTTENTLSHGKSETLPAPVGTTPTVNAPGVPTEELPGRVAHQPQDRDWTPTPAHPPTAVPTPDALQRSSTGTVAATTTLRVSSGVSTLAERIRAWVGSWSGWVRRFLPDSATAPVTARVESDLLPRASTPGTRTTPAPVPEDITVRSVPLTPLPSIAAVPPSATARPMVVTLRPDAATEIQETTTRTMAAPSSPTPAPGGRPLPAMRVIERPSPPSAGAVRAQEEIHRVSAIPLHPVVARPVSGTKVSVDQAMTAGSTIATTEDLTTEHLPLMSVPPHNAVGRDAAHDQVITPNESSPKPLSASLAMPAVRADHQPTAFVPTLITKDLTTEHLPLLSAPRRTTVIRDAVNDKVTPPDEPQPPSRGIASNATSLPARIVAWARRRLGLGGRSVSPAIPNLTKEARITRSGPMRDQGQRAASRSRTGTTEAILPQEPSWARTPAGTSFSTTPRTAATATTSSWQETLPQDATAPTSRHGDPLPPWPSLAEDAAAHHDGGEERRRDQVAGSWDQPRRRGASASNLAELPPLAGSVRQPWPSLADEADDDLNPLGIPSLATVSDDPGPKGWLWNG